MTDVMLDLAKLTETRDGLAASIQAFRTASDFASGLKDAVDRPDDRSVLRDKVDAFESDWNDRRDDLLEAIEGIHEHIVGIIDGWTQWDVDTAHAFTPREIPISASPTAGV